MASLSIFEFICFFSRLVDVQHADADHLKEAVYSQYKDFLGIELGEDEKLPFAEIGIIGAGADGASVNFCCHRGMVTQLKQDMPWLVGVHCVAHRLELAIKDAVKDSFFVKMVRTTLSNIKIIIISTLFLTFF